MSDSPTIKYDNGRVIANFTASTVAELAWAVSLLVHLQPAIEMGALQVSNDASTHSDDLKTILADMRQRADDLRNNRSGGDDYDFKLWRTVADEIDGYADRIEKAMKETGHD